MALIDELKEMRKEAVSAREMQMAYVTAHQCNVDGWQSKIADLDTAIAALEPAPQAPAQPDPPSAELRSVPGAEEDAGTNSDVLAEFMKRAGATEWKGGECPLTIGTKCDLLCADGGILIDHVVAQRDFDDSYWSRSDGKYNDDIIAYRIISQPADQSEAQIDQKRAVDWQDGDTLFSVQYFNSEKGQHPCTCHPDDAPLECQHLYAASACRAAYDATLPTPDDVLGILAADETHTDDLRTAEGEAVAGDDRIETQSVLDDPDFQARVEAAEAMLAAGGGAYVGLQDAQLDADWDAMKERQEAGKKLHFSIFGKREDA